MFQIFDPQDWMFHIIDKKGSFFIDDHCFQCDPFIQLNIDGRFVSFDSEFPEIRERIARIRKILRTMHPAYRIGMVAIGRTYIIRFEFRTIRFCPENDPDKSFGKIGSIRQLTRTHLHFDNSVMEGPAFLDQDDRILIELIDLAALFDPQNRFIVQI